MRLKIQIAPITSQKIVLPLGYNSILQGFLYSLFSKELADELHTRGFLYEKRGFKLFTFSKLIGKGFKIIDKTIYFSPPVTLYFASAVEKITYDLVQSLIKRRGLCLGENRVSLISVKVLNPPTFEKSGIYQTLSPISVYSTKDKKRFFTPKDDEFERLIKENIRKKYMILTGKLLEEFDFIIRPIGRYRQAFVRYKGGVKEGTEGKFFIECEPAVMGKIYDTGIGANNSAGFGMIRSFDA